MEMKIRLAEAADVPQILGFINALAEYEGLLAEVTATEEMLTKNLFIDKKAEVIIGEVAGQPAAFALFFSNFSTFLGKPGFHLEDLFVYEAYRGHGFGRQLLAFLAGLVMTRDYGRLEWWCLDWNQPSLDFYQKMGAEPLNDWKILRLTGPALAKLATVKEA